MDKLQSLNILKQLANGIDPYTGEVLPDDSPYQQPQTVRALYYAIMVLDGKKDSPQKLTSGNMNAGKSWTGSEEDHLLAEFYKAQEIF